MDNELIVAESVRQWARDAFSDAPFVADTAVAAAVRALTGGASVSEACREGRRYLDCCRRHPSTGTARPEPRPLQVA